MMPNETQCYEHICKGGCISYAELPGEGSVGYRIILTTRIKRNDMADLEALNQRLARLAVSRKQSWEAVREAQTLVRTGIANFESRVPHWAKPTPAPLTDPQPSPQAGWWRGLAVLMGALLGLVLAAWWGVG